jgi:hypothetical protein
LPSFPSLIANLNTIDCIMTALENASAQTA